MRVQSRHPILVGSKTHHDVHDQLQKFRIKRIDTVVNWSLTHPQLIPFGHTTFQKVTFESVPTRKMFSSKVWLIIFWSLNVIKLSSTAPNQNEPVEIHPIKNGTIEQIKQLMPFFRPSPDIPNVVLFPTNPQPFASICLASKTKQLIKDIRHLIQQRIEKMTIKPFDHSM